MPAPVYELEYIPASGPAVRQSLAAWGCSFRLRRESWGIDSLALTDTTDGAPFLAPVFGYRSEIVLWRDGSRHWRGWVTRPAAQATPQSDARPYTILGAGWWLSISPWALGWTGTRTSRTVGNWVHLALQRAIYVGAPIALSDTPETDYALSMRAPDLLDSDMCWTLIQRAARYAPNSAGWWDDSGPVSIFRTCERADLAPVTLEVGTQVSTVDELAALHESQLHAVRLIYGHWYDGLGGETWETYTRDRAGDNDYAGPANLLEVRVTVDSYDAALTSVGYGIAAKLYAALNPLSWAGQLTCDESIAALPLIRPGQVVNITGGNAEWATMNAVVAAVELSATPEADTCTIELGPPPPFGPQDFMELFRIAGQAGNSVSGNPTPFPPPTPPTIDPGDPGTYDDLNGSTGGGTPLGSIAVQARGGSWSLLGFAAYVGEPLRRWRLRTFGGARTGYNGYTGCAGMSVSGAAQQAGTQYVEDDGSVTRTSLVTPTAGDGLGYSAPTAITDAYGLCASSEGTGYCRTTTITATLVSTVGVGGGGSGCCTPDGTLYYGYSGTTTAALSSEDLQPAAIGRMLATADWGGATTAIQTIPTVGITGVYREARYRTEHTAGDPAVTSPTLVGLSPWQRYRLTVTLESRPVDSAGTPTGDGSWSAAGTRLHYFVADITGEGGIDWQVVEPTAGYETRIASTLVEAA